MSAIEPLTLQQETELKRKRILEELEYIFKIQIYEPTHSIITDFLQDRKFDILYIPITDNMRVISKIPHNKVIDIIFKTIIIIFTQLFEQQLIRDKTIEITGQHNTYFDNGINENINCMNTYHGCIYCTQIKITMNTKAT